MPEGEGEEMEGWAVAGEPRIVIYGGGKTGVWWIWLRRRKNEGTRGEGEETEKGCRLIRGSR